MMKKRISTAWSSFRGKLGRDRGLKEGELSPGEIAADVLSSDNKEKEPRFYSTQFFFEYLVVVSLKKTKDAYEPQITYQFPKRDGMVRYQKEEQEKTFKAITLFCFPEGINWEPLTEYRSETFSFVLTEIDGSRRNGYCRRLLPHGNGARPPEAYCIISSVACFGLFSKIFDEVEKRRQISMAMIYPFMQSLREAPFPAPGNTVKIKSFIPDAGTEMISLTRPLESWLEHVDFRTLFRCLSDDEVLQVFASTVLERRIVFIAEELSTLSQVIHAVTVLLTPFTWQHTLIPIVPEILIDFVDSPTPYLLGVQKRLLHLLDLSQSDLLVVDLSENREETFIAKIGDEKTLLPHKLRDEILQALKARPEKATVEELNKVVPAAFFPFFIKTVGHFNHHVTRKPGEPAVFQRRNFYKALESKSTRHFVKKFVMTQMFDLFIQEVEQQPASQEGFFQKKVAEYHERMKKEKSKKTKH
ncbi:DENN domain-containing protein 2D-like isoform X2 [Engraulis encrasicolus]